MKLFSVLFALLAATGSLVAISGCNRKPAPAPPAKPGPEESFALIADTFRKSIEDAAVGFVAPGATGHSVMTGRYSVTSQKLLPPTKEGDPYRAIITVDSQANFSIQRTIPKEDPDDEKSKDEQQTDDATQEDPGVEILAPDLVSSPIATDDATNAEPAEVTVSRRRNAEVRDYKLIYLNGRWDLAPETNIDPQTEGFIKNAFVRALATQI